MFAAAPSAEIGAEILPQDAQVALAIPKKWKVPQGYRLLEDESLPDLTSSANITDWLSGNGDWLPDVVVHASSLYKI